MTQIDRLLGIMKRLRDPENGCPWDKEQTFATIAPYTLEETYEVLDAISREDFDDLRGELGVVDHHGEVSPNFSSAARDRPFVHATSAEEPGRAAGGGARASHRGDGRHCAAVGVDAAAGGNPPARP